jgi:replicative DNA helicase
MADHFDAVRGQHLFPRRRAGNDLIIRIEQALLGAVMSDPAQQAGVLDLVHPTDLFRPYHGQVLAAMQRLRARGVAPDPVAVRAELAADPDLPLSTAVDGVLLAGLLQAVSDPRHASAYAAMAIDRGIRQRVMLSGSRMVQAAEAGDLEAAATAVAQAHREVRRCQERWNAVPEPVRRRLPEPVERAHHADQSVWWRRGADDLNGRARQEAQRADGRSPDDDLAPTPDSPFRTVAASRAAKAKRTRPAEEQPPIRAAGEAAGRRLLRDLAAGARHIPAIRSWLRPAHFAIPAHGQIYALICDMNVAGQPIDPVTIAWAASRRGIAASAAGLDGGTAAFAVDSAREVFRLGLLVRTAQTGREIAAAAADPQKRLSETLRDARRRLRGTEPECDPRRRARAHPQLTSTIGATLQPSKAEAEANRDDVAAERA